MKIFVMKSLTLEEQKEQEIASLQVLKDNANNDHNFEFEGLDLVIYKDVFSPSYFNGWRTFTPALRKRIVEGMDFLEIGVGSGITSLLLARDNVNVSVSDISPLAVENTEINAQKNNIKLERVLLSDVYDGFPAQYKFDAIYWNPPWMEPVRARVDNILRYGLFDKGYSNIERFIKQSHLYLKPYGKLYIGNADFGNYKKLESLFNQYDYTYKVIANERSSEIRDVEFYLYEAQLKEKQNQIFISLPHTENIDIMKNKKTNYCKLAEEYNLKILESSFNVLDKDFNSMVGQTLSEIDKAQVLVVDLSEDSIKTGIEIAYARQRCIPVVGFKSNSSRFSHDWFKAYCTQLADDIEEVLDFCKNYCLKVA